MSNSSGMNNRKWMTFKALGDTNSCTLSLCRARAIPRGHCDFFDGDKSNTNNVFVHVTHEQEESSS